MQFVLENAMLIGVVGLLITGMVGYTALQIGQSKLFYAALAILSGTFALVLTSIWIETDREQIRRSMNEIAEALHQNDHPKVFSFLHPNASEGIQRAKAEVPSYTFHRAKVMDVREILINNRTNPPTAISDFVASFSVSSAGSRQVYDADVNVLRSIKIYWMKSGDRWLIRDYQHSDFSMLPGAR